MQFEDATPLAMKMEERALEQRIQVTSGSWKQMARK